MVTRGTNITQADLDALATLANSVGAPLPTNFEFSYMDEVILPPTDLVGTINYGAGGYVAAGVQVVVHVYSYKDVSGRRHYSRLFAAGSVLPNSSTDAFEIEWTWTPPVAAVDGYIYVVIDSGDSYFVGLWQDVTSLPFTDDSLSLNDPFSGFAVDRNPIEGWRSTTNYLTDGGGSFTQTPGQWLFELNRMRGAMVSGYTEDVNWLVSGPWVVSVGSRLRYGSDSLVYGSVEFWYAADDHAGDIDIETVAEIGSEAVPIELLNDLSGDLYQEALSLTLPAAHTFRGRITWETDNAIAGGITHALSVLSGAVTITTETWAVDGSTLTLDFVLELPSGASEVRIDIDLNDGTNAFANDGLLVSDVVLDTEVVTPTDADIIHATSLGKTAEPVTIDPTLGPVVFNGGNYYPSFRAEGDLDGVWVAMTRPVFGIHTYLDSDLPNYYRAVTSGPRGTAEAAEAEFSVTPAVAARSSLWPVFRDTDFGTWMPTGNNAVNKLVPYFQLDVFHSMIQDEVTVAAEGVSNHFSLAVAASYEKLILRSSDPMATIYLSLSSDPIDPNDGGTYDVSAVGELILPDDFAYAGGGTVYYLVKNNELTQQTFFLRRILCLKNSDDVYPGDAPIFFNTAITGLPAFESYSYNLPDSTWTSTVDTGDKLEIPRSGYCIYEVTVARPSVGDIAIIPSTGEAALVVKLGVMLGSDLDSGGTFSELLEVTIPADEPSITTTVFWPVLNGACLAYQCDEVVNVMASANFQPAVISHHYPPRGAQIGPIRGTWSGERQPAAPQSGRGTCYFANGFNNQQDYVVLPICADLYNDTEAVLGIL